MQEMQVQFLGWEDPLEKIMASHSRVLTWKTPRTEEPSGLHKESGSAEQLSMCAHTRAHTHTHTAGVIENCLMWGEKPTHLGSEVL